MKIADIRSQSLADLHKLLAEKRTELVEKKRSLHAGELQNPKSIKGIRRDIAVILTVINDRPTASDKKEEA